MSWNQDTKLLDEIQKFTVTCKNCGHRIRITNKYKRDICNHCGHMVYLYEEDEKKDAMDKFKRNIRRLMK